jgi:hypothetical protein
MGIRGKASRNTLAHANQVRDWRIYADFAQVLIGIARELYINENFGELNWIKLHMHWMQQLLIYVYRFFHGRSFGTAKELLNCIPS